MKLPPELQTALNGFIARVNASKCSKTQLSALKEAVNTHLIDKILAIDDVVIAKKQLANKRRNDKIDFQSKVVEAWAKLHIHSGMVVKFRGNTYPSYVHRVEPHGIFNEKLKNQGNLSGITATNGFDKVWKIKVNGKWYDAYAVASGNVEI